MESYFIKLGPHHGCFRESVPKFPEQIFYVTPLQTAASKFIDNSHSSYWICPPG